MTLPYSLGDVEQCFRSAKNMNAALKHFLKHEVRAGDPAARFVKSFRVAYLSKDPTVFQKFIKSSLERYQLHLLLLGRYSQSSVIEPLLDRVIAAFADDFNETFSSDGSTVTIEDQAKFREISCAADAMICASLNSESSLRSNFARLAVLSSLFQPEVLTKVIPDLPREFQDALNKSE